MSKKPLKCWICGAEGNSGEHMIKESDLAAVLGNISQNDPAYMHTAERRNIHIGSLKNDRLKSPARICHECNTARTQPYDRAWERMSAALRGRRPVIGPGSIVRANRIFKADTKLHMVFVHLFFVKLFGCHIATGDLPIDLREFSDALKSGKPHPCVYLRFGKFAGMQILGTLRVDVDLDSDGSCLFASWFYESGAFAVNLMFAVDGQRREGLVGAWHPRYGTSKLTVSRF